MAKPPCESLPASAIQAAPRFSAGDASASCAARGNSDPGAQTDRHFFETTNRRGVRNAKTVKGRWLVVVHLTAALVLLVAIGQAKASHVDGTWIIKDLVLHIFDCQRSVCGRIVWIKDAARRPSQCGRTIVWGLEAKGSNEWAEGSILDPDDGETYRLSATYEPDGTLHARIFKGMPLFGKTEILKRVDVQKLTGLC
jgi:uncharacterized protein (DUF2147 family)